MQNVVPGVRKRDENGHWLPGVSGNTGGRPESYELMVKLARSYSPRAIKRLVQWVDSDNASASVAAASIILDRAWGRAPLEVILHGPDERPVIDVTPATDEEWAAAHASPPIATIAPAGSADD